jgi:hypothetical protein
LTNEQIHHTPTSRAALEPTSTKRGIEGTSLDERAFAATSRQLEQDMHLIDKDP